MPERWNMPCIYWQEMTGVSTFVEWNPNPCGKRIGDCAVRALSVALGISWQEAYVLLCSRGLDLCDMPSADRVLGSVLKQYGYDRIGIESPCPDCYTEEDFCAEHPNGIFVLFFGGHVACVKDGHLFDSWDSSKEIPAYYWVKKER